MDRGAQEKLIPVCVVAENCLVRAYLVGLLEQDSALQTIPFDQIQRRGWRTGRHLTFAVDASESKAPLCYCLRLLGQVAAGCRFLVLDEKRTTDEIVHLLLCGAHGFLAHHQVNTYLTRAVRFVDRGHYWVPPGVFEAYLKQARMGLNDGRRVTSRESEILDLLRMRLSNKEIAGFLRIRVSTVKFHVTNILSKLQISSRQDLFANDLHTILDKLPS